MWMQEQHATDASILQSICNRTERRLYQILYNLQKNVKRLYAMSHGNKELSTTSHQQSPITITATKTSICNSTASSIGNVRSTSTSSPTHEGGRQCSHFPKTSNDNHAWLEQIVLPTMQKRTGRRILQLRFAAFLILIWFFKVVVSPLSEHPIKYLFHKDLYILSGHIKSHIYLFNLFHIHIDLIKTKSYI